MWPIQTTKLAFLGLSRVLEWQNARSSNAAKQVFTPTALASSDPPKSVDNTIVRSLFWLHRYEGTEEGSEPRPDCVSNAKPNTHLQPKKRISGSTLL